MAPNDCQEDLRARVSSSYYSLATSKARQAVQLQLFLFMEGYGGVFTEVQGQADFERVWMVL